MAQIKVFYEPEMELLTVFWQAPRKEQICTELGDGIILIKDENTGEPIGLEIFSYRPGDNRFDVVSVELRSPRCDKILHIELIMKESDKYLNKIKGRVGIAYQKPETLIQRWS